MANLENLQRRGRKPGSVNKATKSVQKLMARVAKKVDLERRIIELCKHEDPKVALSACRMVCEYRFGRPKEQMELSGSVTNVYDVIAAARARSYKFYEEQAKLKPAEPAPEPARPLLTEAKPPAPIEPEIVPPEQVWEHECKGEQGLRV